MWKTIKSDRKPLIRAKTKNPWLVGALCGGKVPLPAPPHSASHMTHQKADSLYIRRSLLSPECPTGASNIMSWAKCNITRSSPYAANSAVDPAD